MPRFKIMQKLVDKVNLVTREILTGLPVIRAFHRERHEEERFGVDILRKALEEPMRALCSNAGYNGDVEVAKALEAQSGFGLDCETGKYGDMISMGVADPAKVTVTALQAAASVASLILITNCSITEADKKDKEEK